MTELRTRLLKRLGIQAEPPSGVERASRWERWKRGAWMFISTMMPLIVVGWALGVLLTALKWSPSGTGALVVVGAMLLLAIPLSQWLFSWGVDVFDLELPWQFRMEGDRDG